MSAATTNDPKYIQLAATTADEVFRDAYKENEQHGWTLAQDHRGAHGDLHVKVYHKQVTGCPVKSIKGVGVIKNTTPEKLLDLLWDSSRRKDWDNTFDHHVFIEQVDETTDIQQVFFHGAFGGIVGPREFLVLRHYKRVENGIIVDCSVSCHHPSYAQPPKGCVRGNCHPSGFIFEPVQLEGGTEATRVYYLVRSEVQGWIPIALVNKAIQHTVVDVFETLYKVFNPRPHK